MIRYEILMLTVPQITEDEAKRLQTELENLIKEGKGSVISFERWGKYRLAYPIAKNDYGVYFLTRFELPEAASTIEDIKRAFKVRLNEVVIREMIVVLEPGKSLEYQRPLSLEETPEREVGSFIKEKGAGFRGERGERGDRGDRGDRGGFRRGPRREGDRPYDRSRSFNQTATAETETELNEEA